MNKIPKRFLPIGTVVMLKGGTKRVMISGFCAFETGEENEGERKLWDYSGCLYPEGFLTSEQTCLFDHNQIQEIYHLGLSEDDDDEEKDFKEKLNEFMKDFEGTDNIVDSSQDDEDTIEEANNTEEDSNEDM